MWEQKGYLDQLPPLRPYALRVVKESLRLVEKVGSAPDRALALDYLLSLTGAPLAGSVGSEAPTVELAGFAGISAKGSAFGADFGARVRSSGMVGESFGYSASFAYWWGSAFGEDTGLRYVPSEQPTFSAAGPDFPIGAEDFDGLEDIRLWMSYGSATAYLLGGFSRRAFGPFLGDGVVVGERAPPTGQLALVLAGRRLTYTAAIFDLVAQLAARPTGELYSLKSELPQTGFPSKYFALHSLEWRLTDWLSLGAVQGSLFGGRLSLYPLLPTAFITEPFTGDFDNAFAGITGRVRLPGNLSASWVFHVDDYQVVDPIAGFNPSPFSNKVAAQIGVAWAAEQLPASITVDYTFVAPYTYTHSSTQPINYLTFTHRGQSFGSALPPNSDRWALAGVATPFSWLDVAADVRYVRHGNGSDHGAGSLDGDGSIWDDGYTNSGGVTFYGESTFLNQPVVEKTLQGLLSAEMRFRYAQLSARLGLSYGLEHVINPDLNPNSPAETRHLLHVGLEVGL
jgi:hypothetical protein